MAEGFGGGDNRSDYERDRDNAAFSASQEVRTLRARVEELERKRDKRKKKKKSK